MGESRAITGLDRLPWLADESESARRPRPRGRPLAIALLVVGVAALSYWLGTKSWTLFPDRAAGGDSEIERPIPLPDAAPPAPAAEAVPQNIVEPEPVPAPAMVVPVPPVARAPSPPAKAPPKAPAKPAEGKKVEASPRVPWPVRKVEGAAGRLVHVGTFATRRQAKRGWNALMRVNPSLQRLPAMVVPVPSKRDGKVYYRLQMGTTSQAHSVVLCQRLRMIGQSCIVLADAVEKTAA